MEEKTVFIEDGILMGVTEGDIVDGTLKIPKEVKKLKKYMCYDMQSLKRVDMTNSDVKVIGKGCFNSCKDLEEVVFNDVIESIEEDAFMYCTSLNIERLPDSLKTIGKSVFVSCTSIERLILPKKIDKITGSVFAFCYSLKSIEFLADSVDISEAIMAFSNCNSLTNIELDKLKGTIKFNCFNNVGIVGNLVLKNIDVIEKEAFSYCDSLESIEFSGNSINNGAFYSCNNLRDIIIKNPKSNIEKPIVLECKKIKRINNNGEIKEIRYVKNRTTYEIIERIGVDNNINIYTAKWYSGDIETQEVILACEEKLNINAIGDTKEEAIKNIKIEIKKRFIGEI
jgi:hypothetical protein